MAFYIAQPNGSLIRPGTRPGQNIFSSSPIGASQFQRQIETEIRPTINQAINSMQLAQGGVFAGGGGFSPVVPRQSPSTGPSSGITSQAGPYYSIELTRDPQLEAAADSVLQRIQSSNLSQVNRDVRSPMVAGLTQTAGGNLAAANARDTENLADFVRQFTETQPEAESFANQEITRIGELYGGEDDAGSFASNLAAIRRRANESLQNQLRTNLGSVTRSANLAALQGQTNSYTDRVIAQETARILAEQALKEAGIARNDELAIRQAQAAAAGQRGRLLNDSITRQLLPVQASQELQASQLANLARLAGVDLSNLLIEREGDALGREVDLLNRTLPAREAATFRGVGSTEGPDLRGLFDVGAPDYSGYDLDPDILFSLLSSGQQEQPLTLDTEGNVVSGGTQQSSNPLSEDFLQMLLQEAQGGSLDFGLGSNASRVGLAGTTFLGEDGNTYIRNANGTASLIGPDNLTATQRFFD